MKNIKIINRIVYISGILCMGSGLAYIKSHAGWMELIAGLVVVFGVTLMSATSIAWRNYDR